MFPLSLIQKEHFLKTGVDFCGKYPNLSNIIQDESRIREMPVIKLPPAKTRIYKVEELKSLPLGSVFIHSELGKCMITRDYKSKKKYMIFSNRDPVHFLKDEFPWDVPMEQVF